MSLDLCLKSPKEHTDILSTAVLCHLTDIGLSDLGAPGFEFLEVENNFLLNIPGSELPNEK